MHENEFFHKSNHNPRRAQRRSSHHTRLGKTPAPLALDKLPILLVVTDGLAMRVVGAGSFDTGAGAGFLASGGANDAEGRTRTLCGPTPLDPAVGAFSVAEREGITTLRGASAA